MGIYILYHASVESFNKFDENKIRENETDAPFNGFWFSDNRNTSCAWVNPKYLKTCEITLNNPCTWDVVYSIIEEKNYSCTELRKKLVDLGYDGIIFNDKPVINEQELEDKGFTFFKTVRGNTYKLEKNIEYGGIDYSYEDGECITGYEDLDDFLEQKELVVVSFNPNNIKILKEEKNIYWR